MPTTSTFVDRIRAGAESKRDDPLPFEAQIGESLPTAPNYANCIDVLSRGKINHAINLAEDALL